MGRFGHRDPDHRGHRRHRFSREYHARGAARRAAGQGAPSHPGSAGRAPVSVPSREVVPGDVVLLAAGSLVPADGVLIDATDCFVNEAVLTGESFPVEKRLGTSRVRAAMLRRANQLRLPGNQRAQRLCPRPGRRDGTRPRSSAHIAQAAGPAAAGDRVRPRHPALRLSPADRDARDGAAGVRGQRRSSGARRSRRSSSRSRWPSA